MIPVPQYARPDIQHRMTTTRHYIDDNYALPLTLKTMADRACVSPYHFLRLFKQRFGKTPHQYLTQKRIEHAKYYLSRSNLTVTEVCFKVGFESLGSFSTLFRRTVGMSPTRFRVSMQTRKHNYNRRPQLAIPACFLTMFGSETHSG